MPDNSTPSPETRMMPMILARSARLPSSTASTTRNIDHSTYKSSRPGENHPLLSWALFEARRRRKNPIFMQHLEFPNWVFLLRFPTFPWGNCGVTDTPLRNQAYRDRFPVRSSPCAANNLSFLQVCKKSRNYCFNYVLLWMFFLVLAMLCLIISLLLALKLEAIRNCLVFSFWLTL